jgi:hypothetical protein
MPMQYSPRGFGKCADFFVLSGNITKNLQKQVVSLGALTILEVFIMEQKKSNNKRILIALISFILVVGLVAGIYFLTKPAPVAGAKTITVSVVTDDETKDFKISTDEEFLRGALEQENLISGTESEYGLFVDTVNGYKVDDSKNEWWCFKKDGVDLTTGVDDAPIADGDSFEIVLSTY